MAYAGERVLSWEDGQISDADSESPDDDLYNLEEDEFIRQSKGRYSRLKGKPPIPPRSQASATISARRLQVEAARHQLDLIEQEHNRLAFIYQNTPRPNPYNDSCVISPPSPLEEDGEEDDKNKVSNANEKKNRRQPIPCGPFQSCRAFHSQSTGYTEFPDLQSPSERNTNLYNPFGKSASSNPSSETGKSGRSVNEERGCGTHCRHCPKINVSSYMDAEKVYENYKEKITYSKTRIGKQHSMKITEKFEAFESREDKGPLPKPTTPTETWGGTTSFALPSPTIRNVNHSEKKGEMIYGPAAIASVTGYNYNPSGGRAPVSGRSIPSKHKALARQVKGESKKAPSLLQGFEIPLPPDNVRYYDDDSDPIITELLASSEFNVNLDNDKKKARVSVPEVNQSSILSTIVTSHSHAKLKPKAKPLQKVSNPSPNSTNDKLKLFKGTKIDGIGDSLSPNNKYLVATTNEIRRSGEVTKTLIKDSKDHHPSPRKEETTKEPGFKQPSLSPNPVKVTRSQQITKGKRTISSKKMSKVPRFRTSISTVALAQPFSKYKILI